MRPTLHVGCPMWSHRAWPGRWIPAGTRQGGDLAAYVRVVDAVEGNTTFYASPSPAVVARWAEQMPAGFRIVPKAPREVTHERRLRDVDAALAAFVDLLAPLGERVGAITLQLPASFAPVDLPVLAGLLGRLPGGVRWAVEVRHPAFFEGASRAALDAALARHGVERVLLDSRTLFAELPASDAERDAWAKKPRVPALAEALTDRPVVRFIGADDVERTVAGWQPWIPVVAAWLAEGRTPTFFVHTPDNVDSPGLARRFHAEVGLAVPDLAPLPDPPPVDATPVQPSLF